MSDLKSFIVLYDGKFIRVYKENDVDKVIEELKDKLRHYPMMVALLESDKKEIAELKAQKAQAEDDCTYWKAKAQRERHHKFKRCCEEAKICQLRLERYEQYVTKYKNCNGPTIQRWRFLKDHYEKWYTRWFKIAEKFNPNSTATKENSDG